MTECVLYVCEKEYTQNKVTGNQYSYNVSKHQQLSWHYDDNMSHILLTPIEGATPFSENSTYTFDTSLLEIAIMTSSILSPTGSRGFRGGVGIQPTFMYGGREGIDNGFTLLATSLTDNIRVSNKAADHVIGSAQRVETYIHVRWPWVILPIIVTTGSGLLLAFTAATSRSKDLVLWKNSILPLIIGRLQTKLEGDSDCSRNVGEAQLFAKKVKVEVKQNDHSILFVER
jgi:hypothetical protein